jgi:DNA-binding transcriptional LysR family regulator
MQVKALQGHVGLPLFKRNWRQVALTTAGEYMRVYARKVIATLKDAEDAAARLQRLEVVTLTTGMLSTAKYFLPRLRAEFQHEHEGVEIRLAVGNREQLVKMLHGNEVGIAIMGRPPKELATRAEPFAAHPHVFVAPTDHPLLKVGHPTVDSLRPYGFILRERGSGTWCTRCPSCCRPRPRRSAISCWSAPKATWPTNTAACSSCRQHRQWGERRGTTVLTDSPERW